MNCTCIIDNYNCDYPIFQRRTTHRARKHHKCCECGRMIMPGERYEAVVGKWDEQIETYKTCMDCKSIVQEFFCSYFFGEVWDNLYEVINSDPDYFSYDRISRLTPRAQYDVCAMIEEIWRTQYE